MAIMNVNPTRMQMTKLKKQLQIARRGHKMLKDKRDELMRQFIELVRETRKLREKVEEQLENCNNHFINASAVMNKKALESSLMSSKHQTGVEVDGKNYIVNICSLTRLNQDIQTEMEYYGYFATEPNLVIVDEVTPEKIKFVLEINYKGKYFDEIGVLNEVK